MVSSAHIPLHITMVHVYMMVVFQQPVRYCGMVLPFNIPLECRSLGTTYMRLGHDGIHKLRRAGGRGRQAQALTPCFIPGMPLSVQSAAASAADARYRMDLEHRLAVLEGKLTSMASTGGGGGLQGE
jgi:hypothetical protein